ncbi:MAG TPA: GIY-YIG nuclease family protein [bacterium]|nr:GIY-YIG nuclease family protein [bacterium]HPT30020.1 GIY-YIG nuclease family protein [bacterium]
MTKIDKPQNIPTQPGIYFWRDQKGRPLYIGRAVNLRQRLSQYFLKNLDPRIAEMVALAKSLDFVVMDSLLEAIIAEANAIKKYWPKYNIKDKDNRSFSYVVINPGEYPRPIIIRERELAKLAQPRAKIFGPYQSTTLIQRALRLIRPIFPYSTCTPHSGKACFDYQIGLCPGACVDAIGKREYAKNITNLVWLLRGDRKRLLNKLIKENPSQAKALKHLQEVSLLAREEKLNNGAINRIEGYDISHLMGKESYGSMVVFSQGVADNKNYRLFKLKRTAPGDDLRALTEVLERRFQHPEWSYPDLVMIDGGAPQINFVADFLRQKQINCPLVGVSKYGGDRLVFSPNVKKDQRALINDLKITILQVRDEAHRFANSAGRRARRLK